MNFAGNGAGADRVEPTVTRTIADFVEAACALGAARFLLLKLECPASQVTRTFDTAMGLRSSH